LEKPNFFAKNPKTIQSKKLKIIRQVFTQGTFLQNYRKIYQVVSKIQSVTLGWTDGAET
jgi:hypothetical protein